MILRAAFIGAILVQSAPAQSLDLPHLQKDGSHYRLIVDGKPFYVLGAQVHNSSGFPEALRAAWPAVQAMHANTAMVPVYWEAIEPEPGKFDFSIVDADVEQARTEGVHLTLLWSAPGKTAP